MIPPPPPKPDFGALYERLFPAIRGYLRKSLQTDDDDAAELAQDVYVKAWRAWPAFVPETRGADAWLWQIAENLARDVLRHRRLLRFTSLEAAPAAWVVPAVDPRVDPERMAVAGETAEAITAAMARLSPVQRRAIEAVDVWGVTPTAAAAELGVPKNTMANRLYLGRKLLAESLGGQRKCQRLDAAAERAILSLRDALSARQIAVRLGHSTHTVQRVLAGER